MRILASVGLVAMLFCVGFCSKHGVGAATAIADEPPAGRPGIALQLSVAGNSAAANQAKLTVALDYLETPQQVPRLAGVRQYIYELPVNGHPTQIGWKGDAAPQVAVVGGKRYSFIRSDVDRTENGTLSVTPEGNRYRITGIFAYMSQLFVIDAVVKTGEPLRLFEMPADK